MRLWPDAFSFRQILGVGETRNNPNFIIKTAFHRFFLQIDYSCLPSSVPTCEACFIRYLSINQSIQSLSLLPRVWRWVASRAIPSGCGSLRVRVPGPVLFQAQEIKSIK
uniref:Uncharacterized protein n=1 Tax=Picea glauca TaxID=3330 RepID=A0A101M0I5_PICGL|nr:hypothetical protein ABT39_MTgene4673 [Picea glauca]